MKTPSELKAPQKARTISPRQENIVDLNVPQTNSTIRSKIDSTEKTYSYPRIRLNLSIDKSIALNYIAELLLFNVSVGEISHALHIVEILSSVFSEGNPIFEKDNRANTAFKMSIVAIKRSLLGNNIVDCINYINHLFVVLRDPTWSSQVSLDNILFNLLISTSKAANTQRRGNKNIVRSVSDIVDGISEFLSGGSEIPRELAFVAGRVVRAYQKNQPNHSKADRLDETYTALRDEVLMMDNPENDKQLRAARRFTRACERLADTELAGRFSKDVELQAKFRAAKSFVNTARPSRSKAKKSATPSLG